MDSIFFFFQAEDGIRDYKVRSSDVCSSDLKSALDDATKKLGLTRARLDAHLATLGRSAGPPWGKDQKEAAAAALVADRKSTRLNSSHGYISYAVFCLKKKKRNQKSAEAKHGERRHVH